MFFTRTCNRLLRTGLSQIRGPVPIGTPLHRHFDRLEHAITDLVFEVGLTARELDSTVPASSSKALWRSLRTPEGPRAAVALEPGLPRFAGNAAFTPQTR
ncbi:MAG: hypothetical protein WAV54_02185 [Acidimicrobiales bacterium]